MTSVLYSAGLNYQGGNPLRTEIRGLRNSITALETLTVEQSNQIGILKAQSAALEKAVQAATAAAAAAAATATEASAKAATAEAKAEAASAKAEAASAKATEASAKAAATVSATVSA